MGLLSHDELVTHVVSELVLQNRDGSSINPAQVNAASIDIRLGRRIGREKRINPFKNEPQIVDYGLREPLSMGFYNLAEEGTVLDPGEFILAESEEIFNLPLDISAEYKLKSSMARIGLEHLNAGWADGGWHGSVLTLELKNMTQYHSIRIQPGQFIGQMVFFRHTPISYDDSYAARGRYNNDTEVSGIKK